MNNVKYENEKRVEELARDPRNIVYTHAYDTPVQDATTEMAMKLAAATFKLRHHTLGHLDDSPARRECLRQDPTLATYAQTHPQTFRQITSRTQGPRAYQVLQRLATFRESLPDVPDDMLMPQVATFLINETQASA
jgi:hypothetical protein